MGNEKMKGYFSDYFRGRPRLRSVDDRMEKDLVPETISRRVAGIWVI